MAAHLSLRACRYLGAFVAFQGALLVLLLLLITAFQQQLPAPRISSSESFNEKARWLRVTLHEQCPILLIGSSMALNNIDATEIESTLGAGNVVNAASWGLSVAESASLLRIIAPLCKPRLTILVAYYGDFGAVSNKAIDWDLFASYVAGTPTAWAYLRAFDPVYYLRTFFSRRRLTAKGNADYESLRFDQTGSVMFDCRNLKIDQGRWEGYKRHWVADRDRLQADLDGLAAIENIAQARGGHLMFVVTPLREVAETEVRKQADVQGLWKGVSQSVEHAGGVFVPVNTGHYDDSLFVDFAHLNGCGAREFTWTVVPAIRQIVRPEKRREIG